MKTLILTLEYPPQVGGISSFTFNLAAHLPAEETVVWAPEIAGGKEFDSNNGWRIYRGKPYFLLIWPHWLRLLWQMARIVKKEKIERVFVHHVLPVGYAAYIMKKIKKIPYTVFFHGTDLELGAKFKKNKLAKVCRFADEIIVNSRFMKDKLLERLPALASKEIKIVYPCPSDDFFREISSEEIKKIKSRLALDGKKTIIAVGRMTDGKGFAQLIAILPKILQKIPSAVCVLVGDGPKYNQLVAMVQKNNLHNAVRFLGRVKYENLPEYYRSADLFVLLSHKDKNSEEGWGTVFLEAAASGLPVVAGRVGGVEEAVENMITGMVVDAANEEVVIKAITDLLSDPETARIMGTAGRERVLREFTWDKQIKAIATGGVK